MAEKLVEENNKEDNNNNIKNNEINIRVILEEGAKLPEYKTIGSAGMDIFAFINKDLEIAPLERVLVPTGVKMEIPVGYEVQVRPRSGLALKHGLTLVNSPGTIDSDYRGEIKIIMINLGKESYNIKPYDRIGQFILKKVDKAKLEVVSELENTLRGEGGFGHTGKN
ncbi:dUTP diphosphatase [Haliovirga abyssi]|uniref:Deoxyuridine 5'-triphosphate nucleotidohydrolase n=1 Tax=Haliovirga abyssi TaxID=2996794 RepID=A0AAU9DF03_9FUSO|nr:dUTP diphosphatase [Haliovirga abyssi]BDU50768.1 deoxyuridine 5'-triphosphate nucleotidohydrolase [Haliovirga abyssi]